jgi:hypothetical protein
MVLAKALHAAEVKPNALERLAANLLPSGVSFCCTKITELSGKPGAGRIAIHHHWRSTRSEILRALQLHKRQRSRVRRPRRAPLCAAHIGHKALIERRISLHMIDGTSAALWEETPTR